MLVDCAESQAELQAVCYPLTKMNKENVHFFLYKLFIFNDFENKP